MALETAPHTQIPTAASSFDTIKALVADDLQRTNAVIADSLHADVELAHQVSTYVVDGGGKRLRPLLTLLSAKAFNYNGAQHITLAAIVELIHTATLLHDDVVDTSQLRRGRPTANTVWDNQVSVLVGDFLYSRAFQLMTSLRDPIIMDLLANASNVIAQGEVLQLAHRHDADNSEAHYLEVIRRKTAVLFAAAAELGALISAASNTAQRAMHEYGLHLGIAFQMVDDYLDYTAPSATMGKNLGDDLAEGKVTLPLIYAMRHGSSAEAELIRNAITHGGLNDFDRILQILETTQAFAYVRTQAQQHAQQAKQALLALPTNPHINALTDLAQLAVERTS